MDSTDNVAAQLLPLSPRKSADGTEKQPAEMQFVSRRRLAFRPQSIKRIDVNKSSSANAYQQKGDVDAAESEKQSQSSSQHSQNQQQSTQNGIGIPPANEVDKSRRIMWTSTEQTVFYEALKIHGKDFEAIAKYMAKRKVNKDKEQIRNYFLNTFKLWKARAQIDESEWATIPRDARELFVLLNGCEWRKRLDGSSFDQQKFKALVLDGTVSFRPKRKKFLVTIRTPYVPPLLKYFPYDKRGADIPTHLTVKLKPHRNQDREYVFALCEQNPFIQLNVHVNDKISTVFQFLERKWVSTAGKVIDEWTVDGVKDRIKLLADNAAHVHKILVGVYEENFPILSLNRLKKDFESKLTEKSECASTEIPTKFCTIQRDTKSTATSTKEVFEINEDKIRLGLTKENVGNASILELFYVLGMNGELVFNYEINEPTPKQQPWELLMSLANRDYDESIAKSLANPPLMANPVGLQKQSFSKMEMAPVKQPLLCQSPVITMDESRATETDGSLTQQKRSNIIEEENLRFINQIKAQALNQQRRPKRQIKLVHDNKSFNRSQPPVQPGFHPPNPIQKFTIQNGMMIEMGRQQRNVQQSCSASGHFSNGKAVDFSSTLGLHPIRFDLNAARTSNSSIFESHPPTTMDMGPEVSLDASNIISFSPLQSVALDNSPNKSLPEDVRNACEQMLKESSVDYCRKFEKLTRMHQENSPVKIYVAEERLRPTDGNQ